MTAAVGVELFRVRMPLRHPHRAAHGTEDDREVILVAVTLEDGTVGWGECSALREPGYTAEHLAGAWAVLRDDLAAGLLAGEALGRVGHPMASAAVRDARRDADLRRDGRSLVDALGGVARPLATTTVVSLAGSIDDVVARVAAVRGMVKLKLEPATAVEVLRAVRSAFPGRDLAADANGSFDPSDFTGGTLARAIDDVGLRYLEQPVADIEPNVAVAATLATPVALDEPIDSVEAAAHAFAAGAMTVVNVKPARVGGTAVAASIIALAAERGAGAFVGGMLETGVGRATALAVATLTGCTLPTDLGPSDRYWQRDVTGPIVAAADGGVVPPAGPGIGVVPDRVRLAEVTVDHVVVGR